MPPKFLHFFKLPGDKTVAAERPHLSIKLLEHYHKIPHDQRGSCCLALPFMHYSTTVGEVQDGSPHLGLGLGLLTVSQTREQMKNETLVRRNFKSFLFHEMGQHTVELHPSLLLGCETLCFVQG